MKILLLGVALVAFYGPSCSQSATPASDQTIRQVIDVGGYSGETDKELSQMGDAAAIRVVKILGGKEISAHEADGVLIILQLAFSDPKLVANGSDRTPQAALFVLRYLALVATDPSLKKRIEETRKHMLSLVPLETN
jgi:hypothetical protein